MGGMGTVDGRVGLAYSEVLIVAPDGPGLNQVPEVDAIAELGYRVRLLQGEVDDQRLYKAVQDHRYDVVHFMCHGDFDAMEISGGRLTRNAVLQVVRLSGARIVFLNACNSVKLGQTLVNVGLAVVIASVVPVEDSAAWQTAVTFYSALARDGDVARAYKLACGGGDVLYVMLSNGGYAGLMAKPVLDELKTLRDTIGEERAGAKMLRATMGEDPLDLKSLHGDMKRTMWLAGGSLGMASATVVGLGLHLWAGR